MRHGEALSLIEKLKEICILLRALEPLLEKSTEEYSHILAEFNDILLDISPSCTVVVAGPVNSGKSSFVSALLNEGGRDPLAPVSATNETCAPMVIAFRETPALMAHYFTPDVISWIERHLEVLERSGDRPADVALYRDVRNQLRSVPEIRAGEGRGVVEVIDLAKYSRSQMREVIRKHIAQSSSNPGVLGIYRVDLFHPSEVLKSLRNARIVDLYGFGEPNPLVQLKLSRFINDERIDLLVYVFPDLAVTEDFYRLFEIPGFLEDVAANGRLFCVLNKADAYTRTSVNDWSRVIGDFRRALARQVPVLRRYIDGLPIFIMSVASIGSPGAVLHRDVDSIRNESLKQLRQLREALRERSRTLEETAKGPAPYLGTLFDLLECLAALTETVESNLEAIERNVDRFSALVDEVAARQTGFEVGRATRISSLRESLETVLTSKLESLDYEAELTPLAGSLHTGDPKVLFREMVRTIEEEAKRLFRQRCWKIISEITEFVRKAVQDAYVAYVTEQDAAVSAELVGVLNRSRQAVSVKPLWSTVDSASREFRARWRGPAAMLAVEASFGRFANWYIRRRTQVDAQRRAKSTDIENQIVGNVKDVIETFLYTYVCNDEHLVVDYKLHISGDREKTFWDDVAEYVTALEDLLDKQVGIIRWKCGLYRDRRYFVSKRPQYVAISAKLNALRQEAEQDIIAAI